MDKKNYDISIIIINYNSSAYTKKCVSSVLKMPPSILNFEIIVVDNASEKRDGDLLESYINGLGDSTVSLYKSRINTGFGGGNMFGVQQAQGTYYLFLNNDTLILGNVIEVCYSFMLDLSDVAVCGPQMLNENKQREVSFDYFTSFAREVFGRQFVALLYKKPKRRKIFGAPIPVDYVNGSFMLFRAEDFDAVGGFDTNIFLYFEESDICYRLKQQGKKTYFIPTASYIHYQGKSITGSSLPITTKIELKTSMFYVIRKNYGYGHYLALRLAFIVRYGFTSLIKPKYISLFYHIFIGLPLGKSMKQQQRIR